MHTLIKLFYLIIFCSFDILLYFRFGRGNRQAGKIIYFVFGVWLIAFILHLPMLNISQLLPLRRFLVLSIMIIQLAISYFIGMFAIKKVGHASLPDEVKETALSGLRIVFKTGIFAVIFIVHIMFILIS